MNNFIRIILVVMGLLIISSCSPRLTRKAMSVNKITDKDKEQCLFISSDYVSKWTGGSVTNQEIKSVIIETKNRVSEVGGNAYIVTDRSRWSSYTVHFDIYNCNITIN